ncbi:hypothetical protein Pmani_002053 [Petrolisthes manimaculis]|nr:hypothetical protein Pmani_002053 [Petrolisthes manimaculis]
MESHTATPRTSPMTAGERDIFLNLIREEKVINDRRTDRRIVVLKNHAWKRVTDGFNAAGLGPKRTIQQLKKAWERLKVK